MELAGRRNSRTGTAIDQVSPALSLRVRAVTEYTSQLLSFPYIATDHRLLHHLGCLQARNVYVCIRSKSRPYAFLRAAAP